MIRQANKYDKTQLIEMLKQFKAEINYPMFELANDEQYVNELLDSVFAGRGVIFIKDNVGFIFGLVNQYVWCKKIYVLNCVAWVVKPEFRNTTVGYRLLRQYLDYANKLKEEGRIKFFTLGKTPQTPNMNYAKLGFRKTDEIWVQ